MFPIEVKIELAALVIGSMLVTVALVLDLCGFRKTSAGTTILAASLWWSAAAIAFRDHHDQPAIATVEQPVTVLAGGKWTLRVPARHKAGELIHDQYYDKAGVTP